MVEEILGAKVIATAGTDEKVAACGDPGADLAMGGLFLRLDAGNLIATSILLP